jgi:Protein of unknown function (DUF3592)
MTSRQRRAVKILYGWIIPLSVLAADVWFYVSMRGWTYNLKEHGTDAFWPILLMIGGIFFPIAAFIGGKALFDMWSARASTRWRVTQGRVTDTKIEEQEYTRRAWIGYEAYHEYLPKVTYTYEAAGSTYTNDLTAFSIGESESRAEAERVLRPYTKGAPVRVRYDPDDPATSVLQSTGAWALKALGVAVGMVTTPFWLTIMIMMTHRAYPD